MAWFEETLQVIQGVGHRWVGDHEAGNSRLLSDKPAESPRANEASVIPNQHGIGHDTRLLCTRAVILEKQRLRKAVKIRREVIRLLIPLLPAAEQVLSRTGAEGGQ
jgi:hypothetical protein